MYDLKPRAVFAHRRLFDNPLAMARMKRMIGAMGVSEAAVEVIGDEDIDRVVEAGGIADSIATEDILRSGHGRIRQGRLGREEDPVFVFNTFVWDESRRAPATRKFTHPTAQANDRLLRGVGREFAFSRRELYCGVAPSGQYICQGGWGIHTLRGCVHRGGYCGQGYVAHVLCDIEDFADQMRQVFDERPAQKLYRYDLNSDQVCYEPEYGATEVIGGCFNDSDDKELLLYTKSDNLDHLFAFPYQEHVLINWTISVDTVCSAIERGTPSLVERIESMRRCQQHGYTIRCGFTPIIPVRNWRQETTAMLELLFSRCEPEVVRLWVISMMGADELEAMFGADNIDPHCLRRMREEAPRMAGKHHDPFPLDVRCEIYEYYLDELRRLRPDLPVALCTEHPDVWDKLEPKLAMVRNNMFCCCGGQSPRGGWHGPLS